MCPVCAANAALAAASMTSAGGVAALAVRIFRLRRSARKSDLKMQIERREGHGYCNEQTGKSENRVAG
jgi:hypothetical protein